MTKAEIESVPVRRQRRDIGERNFAAYAECGIGVAMPYPGLCRIDNLSSMPTWGWRRAMRHSPDQADSSSSEEERPDPRGSLSRSMERIIETLSGSHS